MSKKDNLKFKKRIKSQLLQEVSQSQVSPKIVSTQQSTKKEVIPAKTSENSPQPINYSESALVKTDLKKSAIIIGSIIVAIIAIYFIDNKTGFLLKASDHVFKFLHISA